MIKGAMKKYISFLFQNKKENIKQLAKIETK